MHPPRPSPGGDDPTEQGRIWRVAGMLTGSFRAPGFFLPEFWINPWQCPCQMPGARWGSGTGGIQGPRSGRQASSDASGACQKATHRVSLCSKHATVRPLPQALCPTSLRWRFRGSDSVPAGLGLLILNGVGAFFRQPGLHLSGRPWRGRRNRRISRTL